MDPREWSAELHRRIDRVVGVVIENLRGRIDRVFADLEQVDKGDGHTPAGDCWRQHPACLADRIRRTLTGQAT